MASHVDREVNTVGRLEQMVSRNLPRSAGWCGEDGQGDAGSKTYSWTHGAAAMATFPDGVCRSLCQEENVQLCHLSC